MIDDIDDFALDFVSIGLARSRDSNIPPLALASSSWQNERGAIIHKPFVVSYPSFRCASMTTAVDLRR